MAIGPSGISVDTSESDDEFEIGLAESIDYSDLSPVGMVSSIDELSVVITNKIVEYCQLKAMADYEYHYNQQTNPEFYLMMIRNGYLANNQVQLPMLGFHIRTTLENSIENLELLPAIDLAGLAQTINDKFVSLFPELQDDNLVIILYNILLQIANSLPIFSDEDEVHDEGTDFIPGSDTGFEIPTNNGSTPEQDGYSSSVDVNAETDVDIELTPDGGAGTDAELTPSGRAGTDARFTPSGRAGYEFDPDEARKGEDRQFEIDSGIDPDTDDTKLDPNYVPDDWEDWEYTEPEESKLPLLLIGGLGIAALLLLRK